MTSSVCDGGSDTADCRQWRREKDDDGMHVFIYLVWILSSPAVRQNRAELRERERPVQSRIWCAKCKPAVII